MESEPEILPEAPGHLPPSPPAEARPSRQPQRLGLHVGLFAATFVSAMWFQSIDWGGSAGWTDAFLSPWRNPALLADGVVFAAALLAILLAHEMGHYLVARRNDVDQSLPYFIPAPTLFGTLGAVILMRSQPANRRVLLRVAAAGPFAGLALALPASIWGLMHSTPLTGPPSPGEPVIGGSLLWGLLVRGFAPMEHAAVTLHPVAVAGWAGLLVTGLNLIPAAQLDGGHIAYALFGRRQLGISRAVVVLLLGMGVLFGIQGPGMVWLVLTVLLTLLGLRDPPVLRVPRAVVVLLLGMGVLFGAQGPGMVWLVWAVLLTLLGLRHPPVRDEYVRLSRRERITGWLALALFVLTFVPVPLLRDATPQGGAPAGVEQPDEGEPPPDGTAEEYRL
jgi:membrane-associated protease RseP (regulator of RpoE activity)